jgi:putative nucleotidyltransferase with HDIG domain
LARELEAGPAADEAATPDDALRLADHRMYAQKERRASAPALQLGTVLAQAIAECSPELSQHHMLVAELARATARELGLSGEEIDETVRAAQLHDLGKLAVPSEILERPGALDLDELLLMRKHPLIGAQIVAPFEFFAGGAVTIRHHHERCDGSGYPDGLAGDAIPMGARVVAVADVFDALTSDRPYRAALPPAAALDYLGRQAGRTLDERVVAAFVTLARGFSPATPHVGARAALPAAAKAPAR